MRCPAIPLFVLLACACGQAPPVAPTLKPGNTQASSEPAQPLPLKAALLALAGARYEVAKPALRHWAKAAGSSGEQASAEAGLIRAELETGHRDGAFEHAERWLKRHANSGGESCSIRVLGAEILRKKGDLNRARDWLLPCQKLPDGDEARLLLGEILADQGLLLEARAEWNRVVDRSYAGPNQQEGSWSSTLVGRAAHRLGRLEAAHRHYQTAEASGLSDPRTLLYHAELYLDAHDTTKAAAASDEALRFAPSYPMARVIRARVRLAQALDFAEAEHQAKAALETNPELIEAYAVLARIALYDQETETALSPIEKGLELEPKNLELGSLKAAALFLSDRSDAFEAQVRQVFAFSPGYGRLYRIVAELAERQHRYQDALTLIDRALVLAPEDGRARAQRGIGMLRAGDERWGRQELRQAFQDDPFDVRVRNTLLLYTQVIDKDYGTFDTLHFQIRVPNEARALLEQIIPSWLEAAYLEMVEEYGIQPPSPIRVELYGDRESFAVRTSGLPETYLQGVCFGRTVVALLPGDESLNLGMTLWHELSHVFQLELSRSRIPRWLAEGLAELSTSKQRPEWTRERPALLHEARKEGRIPSLSQMNRAFTRASSIEDLATAYLASTLMTEQIIRLKDFEGVRQLLRGYADAKPPEELFQSSLGLGLAQIDRLLDQYLAHELKHYDEQFVPIQRVGTTDEALASLAAYPSSPRERARLILANIKVGNEEGATSALAEMDSSGAQHPDLIWAHLRLDQMRGRSLEVMRQLTFLKTHGYDGAQVEMERARLFAERHQPDQEEEALLLAHQFDPQLSAPLYRLAEIARQRADQTLEFERIKALSLLEEADAKVQRRYLELALRLRRVKEAQNAAEQAIYADPLSSETHRLAAAAHLLHGDRKSAKRELTRAKLAARSAEERARVEAWLKALVRGMDPDLVTPPGSISSQDKERPARGR